MSDLNLVKIEKLLSLEGGEKKNYLDDFSVGIVPAMTGAIGFTRDHKNNPTFIEWFIHFKIANSSKRDIIIQKISSIYIGEKGYVCKSIVPFTMISGPILKDKDFTESIEKEGIGPIFPFIVKSETEMIIRVDFMMKVYKKKFLKLSEVWFKKEEIKEPEIYSQLVKKAIIEIRTGRNKIKIEL
jgi:hypothetical protein